MYVLFENILIIAQIDGSVFRDHRKGECPVLKDYSKNGKEIHAVITSFDLYQTLECGQCFRWSKASDNRYVGLSLDHILDIEQRQDRFVFRGTSMEEFEGYWMDYLDLSRDYEAIARKVSVEPSIAKAAQFGWGLRILLQEEWETMISFILSSNNNVKRIRSLVDGLCQKYGRPLDYMGKALYTFPRPEEMRAATCEDLAPVRCGYRASYIVDAVDKVVTGNFDPHLIRTLSYKDAISRLMEIKGIGPKVADCIVLYGGGKYESYPVDVWVKRVTQSIYMESEASPAAIKETARELWGDLAGFAQQYLFFYARENQLGEGEII